MTSSVGRGTAADVQQWLDRALTIGAIPLLLVAGGCSRRQPAPAVNVTAAAGRAEGDIANYAAMVDEDNAADARSGGGVSPAARRTTPR